MDKNPFSLYQRKHIGVSISSNSCHAVEIDEKGVMLHKGTVQFQKSILDSNRIDPIGLAASLKQLKEAGKFTNTYIDVSIPERLGFTREHVFPNLDITEISGAVKWQLEQIFPFSANEIYVDWRLIEQNEDGIRVMVVAILKSVLDDLKAGVEAAGFIPLRFEPASSVVSHHIKDVTKHPHVVTEIDPVGATTTLLIHGVPQVTTTTPFIGVKDFNQAMPMIVDSIKSLHHHPKLEGFYKEFQPTKEEPQPPPLEIHLIGESVNQAIAQNLQQRLQIKTSALQIQGVDPGFELAYFMAKTKITPPEDENSINLLPEQVPEHYKAIAENFLAKRVMYISLGCILPAILFTLIAYLFSLFNASGLQSDLEQAQASGPAINSLSVPDNENIPLIAKTAQRTVKLFPQKVSPEQNITQVLNLIPQSINITGILYETNSKKFTLTGISDTRDELIAFRDSLEETELFNAIGLPLNTLAFETDVEFRIEFTVKEESGQ